MPDIAFGRQETERPAEFRRSVKLEVATVRAESSAATALSAWPRFFMRFVAI